MNLWQWSQSRLVRQYLLWTVLFNTVFSVGYTLLEFSWQLQFQKGKVTELHDQLFQSYHSAISHSLWQLDREQLQVQLEGITALSLVDKAVINDSDMLISVGELQDQNLSPLEAWFIGDGFSVERQALSFHFKGKTRHLGELEIHTALKPVYQQSIEFALSRLAANFIRAIPITLFALYVFNHVINTPLRQLIRHIDSGALLQTSAKPLVMNRQSWGYQAGDEVDQISDALNRMSLNLTELRRTLNSVDEAIVTLDANGYILQSNQSAKQLFETEESLHGVKLSHIMRLRDTATQKLIDVSTLSEQSKHHNSSPLTGFSLERESGEKRRVACTFHTVQSDEHYQGCVLVLRDITEQLEQEERLRMSDKMQSLGLLVGGVSHDVNNALAGILSAAELLKHKPEIQQAPNTTRMLDVIISSANSTSGLLKRLLAFSSGETAVVDTLQLHPLMQDLITIIECTTPSQVKVNYDSQIDSAVIQGASSSIESAILNLSINAVTAMKSHGEISISLKPATLSEARRNSLGLQPSTQYVCIAVRDTGCGMDPTTLSKVFDPFFTTRQKSGGTGLGLSMVYRTLQDHQGAVDVESVVGAGTCFFLYFPLKKHSAKAQVTVEHNALDGNLCYLVVDDEPAVRHLLCQTLESHGNRVLQAENGRQALEVWQRHQSRIDLVISDLNMPLMDGEALCVELKKARPSLEIIVSSGYVNTAMKARLEQLGITRWLNKPYTQKQINQVLGTQSSQHA